ncbi:MAG: hypothetical protein ACXVAY_09910 [Mucilaginibacter sp.]
MLNLMTLPDGATLVDPIFASRDVIKLSVPPRQNSMTAITHPADAALGNPLFASRGSGF